MNRLQQDAADTLQAYEAQAFKDAERARWVRAQGQPIIGIWAPTISATELTQIRRDIEAGLLPF